MSTTSNIILDVENSQEHSPKPHAHNDDFHHLRQNALNAARWFNGSHVWMSIARSLAEIWSKKFYKTWKYPSFQKYCETELDIPKPTAADLRLAYSYLELHHPECLEADGSAADFIPSYTSLALLARKRSHLTEEAAQTLDSALFAGTLTRSALKDEIQKVLAPQGKTQPDTTTQDPLQTGVQPDTKTKNILDVLTTFYAAVDLPALLTQLDQVFNDWEDVPQADRRHLYAQLLSLIDQLETIKTTINGKSNISDETKNPGYGISKRQVETIITAILHDELNNTL